jgi:hypothetical protein
MKSQVFSIDDKVEIVGPDKDGDQKELGNEFAIDQVVKRDGILYYSADPFWWYPASSLRLVEELKIGDWVKVIGPSIFDDRSQNGRIFQIRHINTDGEISLDEGDWLFRPASLRKLTPEEVAEHTGTIGYQAQECQRELEKGIDAMRNLLAPDVYERLSAIEKRQDEAREYSDNLYKITEKLAERIYDLQKRFAFVEACQKDRAELPGVETWIASERRMRGGLK